MSAFPNPMFLFHDHHPQFFIMSDSHQYSRRLLLHPMAASSSSSSSSSPSPLPQQLPRDINNSFDANVVMVLSVLLCALICSLGLNSIIRCALRCSTFVVTDPGDSSSPGATSSARLANTGIKKKALKKFLVINYADDLKLPGLDTECAICLSDFAPGERVRVLPKCGHGFHVRCIDKWLNSHSSCPTCRHCLIDTCNKIIGCSSNQAMANTSAIVPAAPPPPQVNQQEVVIRIEPLQPEGLIRNHEI